MTLHRGIEMEKGGTKRVIATEITRTKSTKKVLKVSYPSHTSLFIYGDSNDPYEVSTSTPLSLSRNFCTIFFRASKASITFYEGF